ncbi:MAG: TolC family protein [Endomicrobia bacterium]|nr:TolC family protein [Endomicrobiia bacterium]
MKKIFFFWFLIFFNLSYSKQITLEEGFKLLYENNTQLKVLKSKLSQARYKRFETFTSWFPKVQLQTQYTKLSRPQMDLSKMPPMQQMIFGSMFPPTLTSDKLYTATLNISQLLFSSGKVFAAYKIACLNYEITKYEYEKTKVDLEIQYKETFVRTLLAKRVLDVTEKTVQISSENYKVSSEMYKEGRVSYLDYSNSKLNYSNAKISYLKVLNNYEIAKQGLKTLLGVDFDVDPIGELEELNVNMTYDLNKLKENIDYVYDIKILQLQRDILKNNVHISRTESLPIVSVVGNYSWTTDSYERNFDEWDDRHSWTLVLSWPIFSSGATFAKVKQAKENLNQVEISVKSLKDTFLLQLNSLYSTYSQLLESLKLAKENLEIAEENYNVAKIYYMEGRSSYLELLQSELNLSNSKIGYYQTLADYIITCEKFKKFMREK